MYVRIISKSDIYEDGRGKATSVKSYPPRMKISFKKNDGSRVETGAATYEPPWYIEIAARAMNQAPESAVATH